MPTFALHTYGCQMNVRDSDILARRLRAKGLTEAETEEEADVVIVNSCSVRGKAEDKALGKLGLLCATKRDRPNRVIGLTGCMAQRLGANIFKKLPRLSFSVGPRAESLIPQFVERCLKPVRNNCAISRFATHRPKRRKWLVPICLAWIA